jgi:hypothetical protein
MCLALPFTTSTFVVLRKGVEDQLGEYRLSSGGRNAQHEAPHAWTNGFQKGLGADWELMRLLGIGRYFFPVYFIFTCAIVVSATAYVL